MPIFESMGTNGPSTRRRTLKLQRFCPFTLNGVTSRFAELHCGSVALLALLASKVEQCSTFEASTEAPANQIIWREIHVIGCWSSFRHVHRQASTHAAVWTLHKSTYSMGSMDVEDCWKIRERFRKDPGIFVLESGHFGFL